MKYESKFFDSRNKKVTLWREEVTGSIDYWKKEDSISYSIERKEYNDLIIRKVLKLDHATISRMFGYANSGSYTSASRRSNIENGIVDIYERVKFEQV